jgi:hypothetical protein
MVEANRLEFAAVLVSCQCHVFLRKSQSRKFTALHAVKKSAYGHHRASREWDRTVLTGRCISKGRAVQHTPTALISVAEYAYKQCFFVHPKPSNFI